MSKTAKQILERVYNKGFNDRCQQEKYADIDNQFVFALTVDQALKELEAYVTTRVKEAERQGAENIINDLISKDAFAEDFEVKELLKTVRTALTTTTNGKESNDR